MYTASAGHETAILILTTFSSFLLLDALGLDWPFKAIGLAGTITFFIIVFIISYSLTHTPLTQVMSSVMSSVNSGKQQREDSVAFLESVLGYLMYVEFCVENPCAPVTLTPMTLLFLPLFLIYFLFSPLFLLSKPSVVIYPLMILATVYLTHLLIKRILG